MKDWKKEILEGVESVSFPGCAPGVIFVYGEKSQAILANKKGHVLCAGGLYSFTLFYVGPSILIICFQ